MWRCVLLWAPVIVLVLVALGGTSLYFLTGWCANDLARKAMDNARAGKTQMAWLCRLHRPEMRSESPEVKRTLQRATSCAAAKKGVRIFADETLERPSLPSRQRAAHK